MRLSSLSSSTRALCARIVARVQAWRAWTWFARLLRSDTGFSKQESSLV